VNFKLNCGQVLVLQKILRTEGKKTLLVGRGKGGVCGCYNIRGV
jgi:hypothetical protein